MYHLFNSTIVTEDPKRGRGKSPPHQRSATDPENRPRVDPQAVDPSLAQMAMHGFMNIPPELAAALVADDGGNLRWLGAAAKATRDFMHFEMRVPPKAPAK